MNRCEFFTCQLDGMENLSSFQAIIDHYLKNFPCDESTLFKNLSWDKAIYHAGLAVDDKGHIFAHQRKNAEFYPDSLKQGYRILNLKKDVLKKTTRFIDLWLLIDYHLNHPQKISGLGELYYYDTAYRLGISLGFEPEHVFLHAGTRIGAQAIVKDIEERDWLEIEELPKEFWKLRPYQIEDILCIYKSQLHSIVRRGINL